VIAVRDWSIVCAWSKAVSTWVMSDGRLEAMQKQHNMISVVLNFIKEGVALTGRNTFISYSTNRQLPLSVTSARIEFRRESFTPGLILNAAGHFLSYNIDLVAGRPTLLHLLFSPVSRCQVLRHFVGTEAHGHTASACACISTEYNFISYKKLSSTPWSRIEIRPTALILTYGFDFHACPRRAMVVTPSLSLTHKLKFKDESVRNLEWKQTDGQTGATDCF